MKSINRTLELSQLGGAIALGLGGALLLGTGEAQAADEIILIYNTQTFTIDSGEIRRFAETGEVPSDLQVFFDDVDQVPSVIQSLLVDDIRIPRVVEEFLDSPTGEFVLIQLDQVVSNPSTSGDLESIRTAVSDAGSDRSISVLELLDSYPTDQVALNISDLEGVYYQVSTFVERIEPAIATAVEFLQEVVCDCETPSTPASAEAVEVINDVEEFIDGTDEVIEGVEEGIEEVEETEVEESSFVPTTGTLVAGPNGVPCNTTAQADDVREEAVQASVPDQQ
ncbi:MAG: alpha/beta hydrolase [Elainellaceae cyanobacterium]